MKPRVYIETTIPSYLTAWPSRDVVRAGHQQATIEWWAKREAFELFISRSVVDECAAGDPTAAAARIAVIEGIPILDQTSVVTALAKVLVRDVPLPPRAATDALHIATAAIHGMQFLLTWNCTHIANANFWKGIDAACRAARCEPPLICTPEQLTPPEEQP